MKSSTLSLIVIFAALMLNACNFGAASLLETAPAATPTPVTVFSLPPVAELATLNSYRAVVGTEFNGKRNGQTAAGRIEQITELDRPNNAIRQTQTVTGTLPNRKNGAAVIEFYQTANNIFVKQDDEAFWFEPEAGQQVGADEFGLMALDGLLVLPTAVTIAPKYEDVNGLPAQRYQFTATDLPDAPLKFTQADGLVWLATADNTLLRYEISGTVQTGAAAADAPLLDEGQLQLSYQLSDINAPLNLPPVTAAAAIAPKLAEIPHLPDATVTAAFPALLEYHSAVSPISATTFYRSQLPELGWTEAISNVFNEKSRLMFNKNTAEVTILISPATAPAAGQNSTPITTTLINVVINLQE